MIMLANRVVNIGEKVTCINNKDVYLSKDAEYTILSVDHLTDKGWHFKIKNDQGNIHFYEIERFLKADKKEGKMKDLIGDVKGFISDNRGVIYTIALVLILDHFVFKGVFRQKVKDLVDKMLSKAESKI